MIPKQNLSALEKLLNEDIQERYLESFNNGSIYNAEDLYEFTKIKPKEEVIQKGYLGAFKKSMIGNAKFLYKFTGVKPDYSINGMKEAIQEGYLNIFKIGFFEAARELYEFTGIKPTEETIQKGYLEEFRAAAWSAKELYEFTGIKPNYSIDGMKDAIQDGYSNLLKLGIYYLRYIKELYEFTGIKPRDKVLWEKIKDSY